MNLARLLTRLALGTRLPKVNGVRVVDGLHHGVTIQRDRYGVTYVDGACEPDVWFGLGFAHGQDRAGQLEVIVRLLRGTLAEVIGDDGLPMDLLTRRLQIPRAGAAQYAVARPEIRAHFDAYAAGINAAHAASKRRPSHEHALLGTEPTAWEGRDCQTFATYLCFMLAANWDIELLRLRVLEEDGPEALKALEPPSPPWLGEVASAAGLSPQNLDRLAAELTSLAPTFGLGGGSNAWAISGARTKSGRPILANDPHLIPSAPSQWYLTRLSTPDWRAAGGSFVGTTALGTGHNEEMAWGVTAGHADHTDLFLEELSADGLHVRHGDGWVACELHEERIAVKGRPDVVERVLQTPRGPLVGASFAGQRQGMSLKATWLAPRPYRGIYAAHRARSADEMEALFEESATTNVGLVYAHKGGDVGFFLAADLPVRKRGFGMLPQPGWDPEAGWEPAPLPVSALPRERNPERGFVAAANAKPRGADEGPFLGLDWLDGYRQARLDEALALREDWDLKETARLQMCTLSLPWRLLRERILGFASHPSLPPALQPMLEAWDGCLEPDSSAASVYQLFMAKMVQRAVREIAPKAAEVALGQGATELLPYSTIVTRRFGHLVRLITTEDARAFPEGLERSALNCLAEACSELTKRFGANPQAWHWGQVRPMTVTHPFGQKAPLGRVFNIGPIAGRGGAESVHQGSMDMAEPTNNVIGCATMRAVYDVGAWENSRFILLGGQSGNPMSPHYEDHVPLWSKGEGVPIYWSDEVLKGAVVSSLGLKPRAAESTP